MQLVRFFWILLFLLGWNGLKAQENELAIGNWRAHIPYQRANSVAIGEGEVFCGSEAGVTSYNWTTHELTSYTTISGLNDVDVRTLKYSQETKTLVIAYKNGNIDVLRGGVITNISSIKNANIIGDKSIYSIFFEGNLAYLGTGFGVVVLNLSRDEVKDTYLIGENSNPLRVNDVYVNTDLNTIYAATEDGVRYANLDDNLSDFNNWSKISQLPDGEYTLVDKYVDTVIFSQRGEEWNADTIYGIYNGNILPMDKINGGGNMDFETSGGFFIISKTYNVQLYNAETGEYSGVIYQYDTDRDLAFPAQAKYDKTRGVYWIADREYGLVEHYAFNQTEVHTPNGPFSLDINNLDIKKNVVWTASGLHDAGYRSSANLADFNKYEGLEWTHTDHANNPVLDTMFGAVTLEINPFDVQNVFSGTWNRGLIEFQNGVVKQIYDASNQAEIGHTLSAVAGGSLIRIGGMAFDDDGNLWITNSETSYGLCVKTASGEWYRYNLGKYLDDKSIVGGLVITDRGHKWLIIHRDSDADRVVVFDDNGTIDFLGDDRYTALTTEEGRGSIPGSVVHCIIQDKSGAIWLGTNEGPVVVYNPNNVFDDNIEAQKIYVEQDGQTQILLETENIKAIEVDGGNRKWFGTSGSGAYLMSEDGTTQISHFTFQNSPLLADEINDIKIDHENGEVFFCTAAGLISYKGTATEGGRGFSDVQVYPNPVTPGYSGVIAIKGLAENSNVKITDLNGVLIFEAKSFGGQAIWDGNSLQGRRANNGVYLVFCTDKNGDSQEVSKLLFLNN